MLVKPLIVSEKIFLYIIVRGYVSFYLMINVTKLF